ncbi:MAG TPA: metallophosphoesterase, partial [Pseudomonadota bacterium]|nr:metallophosphoesterase [Pseudomonadota bacterium]
RAPGGNAGFRGALSKGILALSIAAATLPSPAQAWLRPAGTPAAVAPASPVAVKPRLPLPRFTFAPYLQDVTTEGAVVSFATDVPTVATLRLLPGRPPIDTPAEPHAATASVDRADAAGPASPLSLPLADGEEAAPDDTSSFSLQLQSAMAVRHRLRINGLHPGSRYRYEVTIRRVSGPGPAAQTSDGVSLAGELTTAPTSGSFLFLVYGDTRDRDADHASVVQAMVNEHPDFVLQTGDLVSRASDELQWRRYFSTAAPLLRNAPLYPALGNHELRGEPGAGHFQRLFLLPPDRSRRLRPVYYAFRFSNSLFIALDGNSPYDQPQAAWLEQQLKSTQADSAVRHVFVFIHQPPYAVGAYCGSQRLQQRIVPILQRYGVRAVFAGHEHAYQHLERKGVRYFVTGGGGAPLYPRRKSCNFEDDTALWMFRAEHHYLRVQVDGDQAVMTAVDRRGNVMERVGLHEPPGDAPPLHQLSPDLPTPSPRPRWLLPARLQRVPLLSMSKDPRESTDGQPAGALVLLGLSSITVLAGLWVLIRPGQRRREGQA